MAEVRKNHGCIFQGPYRIGSVFINHETGFSTAFEGGFYCILVAFEAIFLYTASKLAWAGYRCPFLVPPSAEHFVCSII